MKVHRDIFGVELAETVAGRFWEFKKKVLVSMLLTVPVRIKISNSF